jgi:hypothetical protein
MYNCTLFNNNLKQRLKVQVQNTSYVFYIIVSDECREIEGGKRICFLIIKANEIAVASRQSR